MVIPFFVLLIMTAVMAFILGMVFASILLGLAEHAKADNRRSMWHMSDMETGMFIQEFFNCDNIHTVFIDLDKKQDNFYTVKVIKENGTIFGERNVRMRWVN